MKYIAKSFIISAVLCLMVGTITVSAHQSRDSVAVYFRQGDSAFEREYRDNGAHLDEFIAKIQLIQELSDLTIRRVDFIPNASLGEAGHVNQALAQSRASVMAALLHEKLEFADSLVHLESIIEDWDGLSAMVKSDQNVPNRKAVLKIIQSAESEREQMLRELDGGNTWDYLKRTRFPDLRSFRVFIYSGSSQQELAGVLEVNLASETVAAVLPKVKEPKVKEPKEPKPTKAPKVKEVKEPKTPKPAKAPKQPREQKDSTDWTRQLTVKTNVLGAAFLMANAAVEVDIIKNLTFALPVYWSGWDYAGINTLKFRTLTIQPEIRYYIPRLEGFYVGAHFGMGYWNIALGNLSPALGLDQMDGWRYQDHKGESPAIGGGLGVGYAFQFKKNPRWGMEFALGAGVYDAKYDVFYNEPNGPYHKPCYNSRTTYIGIDNASVSFTYKFDLRRSDNSRKSERKEKEGKR